MEVTQLQKSDFDQVLLQLDQFWGERHKEVRPLHHPMFVYEFGETGLVIRIGAEVVAYLLGFIQKERSLGYIHFVGVRKDHRKRGLAAKLYERFIELAADAGCNQIKAITTAGNLVSLDFHKALGFELALIKDYRAPGEDRVVLSKKI